MAIPYIEATEGKFSAGRWTRHRPSRLRGLLGALIAGWARLGDLRATRITLDEMSEGQLEDIGMRRVGHGVRWLDCRETSLRIDYCYRSAHSDERTDGGLHL